MNKKLLLVMAALTIPTTILAATPDKVDSTVAVRQEGSKVQQVSAQVGQDMTEVGKGVSQDMSQVGKDVKKAGKEVGQRASSWWDKVKDMADSKTQVILKHNQMVVVPNSVEQDHFKGSYPMAKSINHQVQTKVNEQIQAYVKGVEEKIATDNAKETNKYNGTMNYKVHSNANGILSVVIDTHIMQDKAAHGITEVKSFNFDTKTGEMITLQDLGGVTVGEASQAVKDFAAANPNKVFNDFKALDTVPSEFAVNEKKEVSLIFPQGEISPMSSGILYVPVHIVTAQK